MNSEMRDHTSQKRFTIKWDKTYGLTNFTRLKDNILPSIGFSLLKALKEQCYRSSTQLSEMCLVILSGKWSFKISGLKQKYRCERSSVFEEKAYALYLPPDTDFELKAEDVAIINITGAKIIDSKTKAIIFEALNKKNIHVKAISQSCDDLNLSLVINTDKLIDAIKTINADLCEDFETRTCDIK